jgi:hypothetical protein
MRLEEERGMRGLSQALMVNPSSLPAVGYHSGFAVRSWVGGRSVRCEWELTRSTQEEEAEINALISLITELYPIWQMLLLTHLKVLPKTGEVGSTLEPQGVPR